MLRYAIQNENLALVALGANLPSSTGSLAVTLRKALSEIIKKSRVTILSVSRFWLTPAFPAGSGPDYVNAAAILSCGISAQELLDDLHRIEADFGRIRKGARWQSRVLDLDLLAYGDQIFPDVATQDAWRNLPPERQAERAPDGLILPHPRLQDRGFVLAPLAEIAPDWHHPRLGLSVLQMLSDLPPEALKGMRIDRA